MATEESSNDTWRTLGIRAGQVFRPSAPVDEEALFAGRTTQMRRIADAVNQPGRHAVIFGERGVGKTSLAIVLSKHLINPAMPVAAPRINCDSADDYASVWEKVFSQIQLIGESRRAGFIDEPKMRFPVELMEQIQEEVTPKLVRRMLSLLSSASVVVVMIDEFDRIQSRETRRLIADTIKTLSDQNIGATIVLVGVADSVDDLIVEHESTERAIVQIPMPRMSMQELNEILDKGLERLGMTMDANSRSFITLLSQGLPTYTHLLALHSARAAVDEKTLEIVFSHTEKAIRTALHDVEQSVRSLYDKAVASPRGKQTLYPQVLLACALAETGEFGYFTAANVRIPLREITGRGYDIPNFAKHLKEFSEPVRGPILQRIGETHRIRYRFSKPLMQPFVIMKGLADGRIDRVRLERLSHWSEAPLL